MSQHLLAQFRKYLASEAIHWGAAAVKVMSLSVLAIGMFALCGHLSRAQWMYLWSKEYPVGMALNTAIAMTLTGLSLFMLSLQVERAHEKACRALQ